MGTNGRASSQMKQPQEAELCPADGSVAGTPMLWPDIDHAEKCLLSAMYEEAAEVANSALRTLMADGWDEASSSSVVQDEPCRQEVGSMIEAAGMVLLQARNEMDRPCNIFCELVSIFDGVGMLPYSLVLTGTCLQLSMGFHPASQTVIEEYLSGWRSLESSSDGLMVNVVQRSVGNTSYVKSSQKVHDKTGATRTVYLSTENYLQLTEIYAIEVLAKLRKNPIAAHLWIRNSSILEGNKQVILGRLEQLESKSQNPSPSSSTEQKSETSPRVVSEVVPRTREESVGAGSLEQEGSTGLEPSQVNSVQLAPAAEEFKSRVIRGSGMWRFPFVRTVLRLIELVIIRLSVISGIKWTATKSALPQSRLLWRGVLTSMIVYAILRNRQLLRRWTMQIANLARVCFSDLWRLAFTVHLNPLAVAYP